MKQDHKKNNEKMKKQINKQKTKNKNKTISHKKNFVVIVILRKLSYTKINLYKPSCNK